MSESSVAVGPVPGMPEVKGRPDAEPGAAPGVFRADWELSERAKQERARRRQRNRKWAIRACVIAVVAGVAFVAYPRVHTMVVARSVAPDLRGYVEGHGTTQPVAGYAVRLPQPLTVSLVRLRLNRFGPPAVMRAATVIGADYRIAVWDAAVPAAALPHGALDALSSTAITGPGARVALRTATIGGEPATVATFAAADGASREVAVFPHAGRLFVIRVQAKSADVVLDALAHSFRFTP